MSQENSDEDQIKRFIHTRGGNRAAIARLEKEISQLKDKELTAELSVRINSIALSVSQKQQFLTGLDEKILEKIPLEQMDREIDDSMEWDIRITTLLQHIEGLKKPSLRQPSVPSTQTTTETQPSPAIGALAISEVESQNRSFSSVSSTNGVRLPKIELPKVNGDITQFNSFWQAFNCAVHSNDTIPEVHKLNYLMNLLEGPAHRVVAGLELTEENYQNAIETLKTRFGNKQRIISAHMQSLLKLQDCPNDKVAQLRYIYDKINVHVRGLESLGMSQESYDGLLIPIIMQRMPSEITIHIARKVTEDIWPIKEILEIIRCEIEARELGESVLASKQVNRQPHPTQVYRKQININTFGSDKYNKKKCELVSINIEVENQVIPVRALSYPTICSPFASRGIEISEYPHLHTLKLADSVNSHTKHVQLLIGADHYYDFVTGDVIKGNSGPVAVSSKLGLLLTGPSSSTSNNVETNIHSHLILDQFSIFDNEANVLENSNSENLEITESLKQFWKQESMRLPELVENTETESTESDEKNEQTPFDIKFNGERYEVSLPWRADISHELLSDNYDKCLIRLKGLYSRLKKDPKLFSEYNSIFQEQLDKGIIEYVPNKQGITENIHYLSHHGVVRKEHDTTKLRIVFDGSAKSQPNQLSLNDCLQLGDNYMPSLFDTLLRFRAHSVAMTSDIEKAFLQIEIKPADRDSLRFLWFDDINKENPSIIQLRWGRLAFGLKPSPSILGATIRQHFSSFEDEYPKVVKVLSRLYADDMSCSVKLTEEALEIYKKSK
ncbi:uncharacterized protein LOC135693738 [Rhopilema esculentum]|uniref:uncharacterized protein LOC135693738 n=1 Tax=Rhopilema esculentum TaxID=499914 RepID=UPI0031DB2336